MSSVGVLAYALAVIIHNNHVLLGRRINTEWFAHHWGLMGGTIERDESATQALARELSEEIGITIASTDIELAHVMHFYGVDQKSCIALFFMVKSWEGEISNNEPHKNETLAWFSLDALPHDMVPRHAQALKLIAQSKLYSEDNWGKK